MIAKRILTAAALALFGPLGAPAAANMPPAPLSEAMQAVVGDYTLGGAKHGSDGDCTISLAESWAKGSFEVYANVNADAACIDASFAEIGLKAPLSWTLFAGGGIVLKSGDIEVRFLPNYERGTYLAYVDVAGDRRSVTLNRKP